MEVGRRQEKEGGQMEMERTGEDKDAPSSSYEDLWLKSNFRDSFYSSQAINAFNINGDE